MKKELRRDWQLWVMALLGLIWVIVFCYTPMYGIQLAFKDYDFTKGLTGGDWAGIKYFMMYFNSPAFATTMRNTFVIAFFSIKNPLNSTVCIRTRHSVNKKRLS